MSNIIVVLGAGASKGMGLPLLNEVFGDQAVRDYLANDAPELLSFLNEYIWQPRDFTIDSAKSALNIEEVLTLLREWSRSPNSPISKNLNEKIQKQLLGCVHKAVYTHKGKSDEGRFLNKLIAWCDQNFDLVTWATFNWDTKLEQAFFYQMKDQGEGMRLPSCSRDLLEWEGRNDKHFMLKLHGSVSWFQHQDGTIHNVRFGGRGTDMPIDQRWSEYLSGATGAEPVIAEPSFYKHEFIKDGTFLGGQWNDFNERLAFAEVIIVCGYSLPDGDALAKHALLTSVANNPDAQWIVVNPSSDVLRKYSRLLGERRTTLEEKGLEEFVVALYGST